MAFDSRLLSGLPILAAVLEAGSFVRAGESLGLTQSGVSRAIQRLEERLGIRLFERTSKAMRLTEDGSRFCEQALPLLTQLEETAENLLHDSGQVRGRLRINVDGTISRLFLAPRIGEFLAAHPGLQFDLQVQDRIGDLVAGGFDAAIRLGDPEPSSLIARRLLQVRVLTCASPAYIELHGLPKKPADLALGHEGILYRDPATGRPFAWEFHRGAEKVTVDIPGRLTVNDALTHLEACAAGHGLAQLVDLGLAPYFDTGRLVHVLPKWSDELFPVYVYYPSRHFVPAKLRAFLDFLVVTLQAPNG
ncbi:MAG: transcriptional regulator, LysR family [Akkermansiaceae bacterium]|nr:transcriptional regulator, LysR family [Akkermansiaceae bacterium]